MVKIIHVVLLVVVLVGAIAFLVWRWRELGKRNQMLEKELQILEPYIQPIADGDPGSLEKEEEPVPPPSPSPISEGPLEDGLPDEYPQSRRMASTHDHWPVEDEDDAPSGLPPLPTVATAEPAPAPAPAAEPAPEPASEPAPVAAEPEPAPVVVESEPEPESEPEAVAAAMPTESETSVRRSTRKRRR